MKSKITSRPPGSKAAIIAMEWARHLTMMGGGGGFSRPDKKRSFLRLVWRREVDKVRRS